MLQAMRLAKHHETAGNGKYSAHVFSKAHSVRAQCDTAPHDSRSLGAIARVRSRPSRDFTTLALRTYSYQYQRPFSIQGDGTASSCKRWLNLNCTCMHEPPDRSPSSLLSSLSFLSFSSAFAGALLGKLTRNTAKLRAALLL